MRANMIPIALILGVLLVVAAVVPGQQEPKRPTAADWQYPIDPPFGQLPPTIHRDVDGFEWIAYDAYSMRVLRLTKGNSQLVGANATTNSITLFFQSAPACRIDSPQQIAALVAARFIQWRQPGANVTMQPKEKGSTEAATPDEP